MESFNKVRNIESEPTPKPPRVPISLIELEHHGARSERKDAIMDLGIPVDPYTLKPKDYNDRLIEAREMILGGPKLTDEPGKLMKRMIEAARQKTEEGVVEEFARIENKLIKICINLKDEDIESIINQWRRKFLDLLRKDVLKSGLVGWADQEIRIGKFDTTPQGIKSVVHFARERIRLLMGNPPQRFTIGLNNRLDALKKIDLIEMIYGETNNHIERISFAQIKSSPFQQERDIDGIVEKHRNFAEQDMATFEEAKELHPDDNLRLCSIDSVNSIVAVDRNIIREEEVYNSTKNPKGALAAIM